MSLKQHVNHFANDPNWRGHMKSVGNRAVWTTTEAFYFGGKLVPANTEVKQFETANFGWTVWTGEDGNMHVAQE